MGLFKRRKSSGRGVAGHNSNHSTGGRGVNGLLSRGDGQSCRMDCENYGRPDDDGRRLRSPSSI